MQNIKYLNTLIYDKLAVVKIAMFFQHGTQPKNILEPHLFLQLSEWFPHDEKSIFMQDDKNIDILDQPENSPENRKYMGGHEARGHEMKYF